MRPPRTVGSTILSVVLIWVMTAIAAAAFWPVYRDVRFVILVVGALIGGTLVAALGARFRWPSYVVVAATFAVFLLSGVQLAVPARAIAGVLPSLGGLADLLGGVALGWKQLLTITLPVGAYQALLVPAFVLLLTTTVVGISVALRARFGELAVIAPVVAFLVAIAFGSAEPLWPVPLALGMLVTVLTFLIWRRWRRRREAIRALARATPDAAGRPLETAGDGVLGVRTIVAGGVILAIAAASSVGATLIAPVTGGRDVLRTAIEQPFDPRNYPSPLAGFRRYLREDRADQVMMRVQGLPDGALVRIATLDSYDGVVYAVGSAAVDSASGTFVRIPQAVDQSAVAGKPVDVNVEIENYSGVWVPTVGDFSSIDFGGADAASRADSFRYNASSGTAAVLTGLSSGDSYRLHAVIPDQPAEASLADASPGDAVVPRVQGLPEELSLYLEDKVRLLSSPGDRLLAMLAALRTDGYISHGLSPDEPSSRSGHAADRIAELVTAPQMIGDAEQYAVAAALMARQLGFPARVVFGFAPQNGVVTGADVTAWIEVDTAQYGWVAVNPVPQDRPIPAVVPEEQSQVARPPSVVPPPPDRPDQQVDQSAPDSAQDTPDALDPLLVALLTVARVTGITLLAAGVLLAPFLVIIAAKARRRRLRRTAPTVVQRISGGWDEFADAVVDHGFNPPPAATRSELAAVAGGLPSRVLAAVADRAVFAPEQAESVDAHRVWDTVADLRLTLDQGLTRRQRLRALVSVRSLGAYSVRSLFRREAKQR
ncbi:MAG: transglutaminaseTgpA domain-containing protein [Pseudolysinimonas sp.]|uniref:transglutaminaseTgpA domain-containing protein n=1 Tax=Pseudolysinimonas sp. TaxID=2680009 RepID=UPI003267544C